MFQIILLPSIVCILFTHGYRIEHLVADFVLFILGLGADAVVGFFGIVGVVWGAVIAVGADWPGFLLIFGLLKPI